MVAKRHKITNVPLFKKLWDIIFFWDNNFLSHFEGHFEGAKFLKQRDINSYLGSAYIFSYSRICRPIVGYINRSQTHKCGNWD